MSSIDISIVIVNYNVKDFLFQCIQSIKKSISNLNIEIIVVDNNSSDNSVEFLSSVFQDVKFIRLNENLGFGKANNIGFADSNGKYILILNPDTILEETTLEKMYSFMENNPETGISGCKVLNHDGTFQVACRRGFPTPWVSFTKLFGLQSLFPKSKLFARYNQTYKDINDTYYVDSVIGAFMFIRREVYSDLKGFDTDFFMYGEDIDLCYRAFKTGWKISYVHTTSIIHFKGESTRRSNINQLKHFYDAMEIFSRKHYSNSSFFLFILRIGINIRASIAKLNKYKSEILIIFYDLSSVNLALILATKIRFLKYFSFPTYAYPTIFLVLTIIMFFSMVAVGEYFEGRKTIRKYFSGLMISFFVLSSLTYFFNDYAFSRGVLLMTIGFSLISGIFIRIGISLYDKLSGKDSDKRLAIIGLNENSQKIIYSLQSIEKSNTDLVGLISVEPTNDLIYENTRIIGNIGNIIELIETYKITEVIITEKTLSGNSLMKLLNQSSHLNVRFHIAHQYEEVLSSRIINEIAGIEPSIPKINIDLLRNKILKRSFDIIISSILLTIGLLFIFIIIKKPLSFINKLWLVLTNKLSLIGIFPLVGERNEIGKPGIIGLAHISKPQTLPNNAIKKLNVYYIENYNLSLDIDIFIKFIMRKKRGN